MILAAESAPEAAALGEWVKIFFYLLGGLAGAAHFWKSVRPSPANHETYATKAELRELAASVNELTRTFRDEDQRLHSRVSGARDEFTKQLQASREAGEIRAERIIAEITDHAKEVREELRGLHRRVDDTSKAVARIEGQVSKEN